VRHTTILRDGTSESESGAPNGLYSLSRAQAAWWFFFVVTAYLLIGLVTGDFLNSINGTALTLLAIGAGTAAASSVITKSKDTPELKDKEEAAREKLSTELRELRGKRDELRGKRDAEAAGTPERLAILQELSETTTRIAALRSQRRKLFGESEGFFRDIISDANGASFHRFQMVAWTAILGFVFIREVYENLAMPTFSAELLGLQGLSAATYVGLKITEAEVPSK
jgi:hypothetical protein